MTAAFQNSLATYVQKAPEFTRLSEIDAAFQKICENLTNPPDLVAANLLLRAHSAYRAAVRLATSGQVTEAYPVLRSCIEYALYALHINKAAGLSEVWLRRHDSAHSKKQCIRAFTHGAVLKTLEGVDPQLASALGALYERTIDYGGHPNERGVSGSLTMDESDGGLTFKSAYLQGAGPALDLALKSTAQVALGVLAIFERIFTLKCRLLGVDTEIERIKRAPWPGNPPSLL
jgi:hypothetical protein